MTCDCSTSEYIYQPHGHVITGDLSIVQNDSLCLLFQKGPKYREQEHINWNETSQIINNALDKYALAWAKREEANVAILTDWLDSCKTIIEKRIIKIKDKIKQPPNKILLSPKVKRYLKQLHTKYVLAPADKAANNIIFICKKFYYSVLSDELKVNHSNPNNTYSPP